MSDPTYKAFGLLQDHSNFSLEVLHKHLVKRFPATNIVRKDNCILLSQAGWTISVYLSEEAHVAQESEEIAEFLATYPQSNEISKCKRRVEIISSDPDPNMDYFNDYIILCGILEEFQGVILFDPMSCKLMKE